MGVSPCGFESRPRHHPSFHTYAKPNNQNQSLIPAYGVQVNKKFFILGGIKSGKSRFSLRLAEKFPPPRVFIATAEAFDEEMALKIQAHQKERGKDWITIEAPLELPKVLKDPPAGGVYLVDCLTVWLGNLWYHQKDPEAYIKELLRAVSRFEQPLVMVSNEVGLGLIPESRENRRFAERLGLLNQAVAKLCHEVYLVVAGYPWRIK